MENSRAMFQISFKFSVPFRMIKKIIILSKHKRMVLQLIQISFFLNGD